MQIAFVHNNMEGQAAGSWLRRDLQIEGSISRVVGRINSNFSVMGSRVPVYYLQHDPVQWAWRKYMHSTKSQIVLYQHL